MIQMNFDWVNFNFSGKRINMWTYTIGPSNINVTHSRWESNTHDSQKWKIGDIQVAKVLT